MVNKVMSAKDVVASIKDGMTIGIGGWGPRRKPMGLVRELLRSDVKDLTVVAYGGADVGMLCAAGKVKKLVFAFVSLDAIPLEPWFRKARESGQLEVLELDEGMFQWGLQAAAFDLPFLPTRVGLGTDLAELGGLKTVQSPYDDGEVLLAMPALRLDVALVHVNVADQLGNTLISNEVSLATTAWCSRESIGSSVVPTIFTFICFMIPRAEKASCASNALHCSQISSAVEGDSSLPVIPNGRRSSKWVQWYNGLPIV